jgi:hypothetical protein
MAQRSDDIMLELSARKLDGFTEAEANQLVSLLERVESNLKALQEGQKK